MRCGALCVLRLVWYGARAAKWYLEHTAPLRPRVQISGPAADATPEPAAASGERGGEAERSSASVPAVAAAMQRAEDIEIANAAGQSARLVSCLSRSRSTTIKRTLL